MGKADLHTHTKYSGLSKVLFLNLPDAITEPEEVVKAAEKAGLDVVCVTDHNSTKGGLKASKVKSKVEVVVGEEIGTRDGEILGLFLTEEVPRNLTAEETIDVIHSMGGVAVAPHPFSAHCSALGRRVFDLHLDGIEVLNAAHRDIYTNDVAQKLCANSGKALTGGSDAHAPAMVANAYTTFSGTTSEDLRKSILSKSTGYAGRTSSMRDLIWMTAMTSAKLSNTIAKSIANAENHEDALYAREIYSMRRITKYITLVGSVAFLAPPIILLAAFTGERLHSSRSKAKWEEIVSKGSLQ